MSNMEVWLLFFGDFFNMTVNLRAMADSSPVFQIFMRK